MCHNRLKKILRETKKEMKFLWDRSDEKIQHFSRNKINRFGFPLAYLIFRQSHRFASTGTINLEIKISDSLVQFDISPPHFHRISFEIFGQFCSLILLSIHLTILFTSLTNSSPSTRVLKHLRELSKQEISSGLNRYCINYCRSWFCIIFKFHKELWNLKL